MCMFGITYRENIYEIWNTLLTHTNFNIFRAHWMLCTHKSTLHCAQISTWSTQWDIIVQDKDGHSALDRINFHTVTVGSTRTQLKMIWLSPLLLLTDVENFKNLSFIEKSILYKCTCQFGFDWAQRVSLFYRWHAQWHFPPLRDLPCISGLCGQYSRSLSRTVGGRISEFI